MIVYVYIVIYIIYIYIDIHNVYIYIYCNFYNHGITRVAHMSLPESASRNCYKAGFLDSFQVFDTHAAGSEVSFSSGSNHGNLGIAMNMIV